MSRSTMLLLCYSPNSPEFGAESSQFRLCAADLADLGLYDDRLEEDGPAANDRLPGRQARRDLDFVAVRFAGDAGRDSPAPRLDLHQQIIFTPHVQHRLGGNQ